MVQSSPQILKALENESIEILRETAAGFAKPVMLYSIGKDSSVLLHLARKAFYPAPIPFPLLHIDTTWKFKEMISFRDEVASKYGLELIVHTNQEGVQEGVTPFTRGISEYTRVMKTLGLRQALDKYGFDGAIGGSRRDEEKSRAKERIFSVREAGHRWNPREQRPELWRTYNTRLRPEQSMRIFPISDWTELDVWNYIKEEKMEIPSIYYSHQRQVIERDGMLWADSEYLNKEAEEIPFEATVRFRTVGDMTCTAAVASDATDIDVIIEEILSAEISERGARIDDKRSEAAMEKRKQQGYF